MQLSLFKDYDGKWEESMWNKGRYYYQDNRGMIKWMKITKDLDTCVIDKKLCYNHDCPEKGKKMCYECHQWEWQWQHNTETIHKKRDEYLNYEE